MVVKKSPIAKSRLHRIDIDQGNFSLERVEADLRAGEARLAQEGALDQGALLVRHAPAAIADAYSASRLAEDWGRTYGTLPRGADLDGIIRRIL